MSSEAEEQPTARNDVEASNSQGSEAKRSTSHSALVQQKLQKIESEMEKMAREFRELQTENYQPQYQDDISDLYSVS